MNIHVKDDLFKGFTYEDLIVAVQSNEPVINKEAVKKVFNEILKQNLRDAWDSLNDNIDFIIKNIK